MCRTGGCGIGETLWQWVASRVNFTSSRAPCGQSAWSANPRTNASNRHALPGLRTFVRWTAGGDRGDPSCGVCGSTADPSRTRAGDITGFPSSLLSLTPSPSRPRSRLKLHLRECRTRSPELAQSRTDPGGREFPTGRGPAGRWHAAGRQTSRVQICTSRFFRGLPPEGFAAGPQEAVSGRFLGGDEAILHPGPARARSRPYTQPHGHSGERRPGRIRSTGAVTQSRPGWVLSFFPPTRQARAVPALRPCRGSSCPYAGPPAGQRREPALRECPVPSCSGRPPRDSAAAPGRLGRPDSEGANLPCHPPGRAGQSWDSPGYPASTTIACLASAGPPPRPSPAGGGRGCRGRAGIRAAAMRPRKEAVRDTISA